MFLGDVVDHLKSQVEIGIKYPKIKVFKCNEKHGITLISTTIIDSEMLKPIEVKKVSHMVSNQQIQSYLMFIKHLIDILRLIQSNYDLIQGKKSDRVTSPETLTVKDTIQFLISNFNLDDGEFRFDRKRLTRAQWVQIFNESIYNEEV